MIIANPIYDKAFKRLMENERVAKFFIGTLLEENIVSLEAKPQEFTYTDQLIGLALIRLDYVATVKTAEGEYKKILVEIQKAKGQIDVMRFRNYLAEQYKKEDMVNSQKAVLPITTIYILAFNLPEIETACIKVERNYRDLVNHTVIDKKSDFVEKLSHDCFVVQAGRITGRYQTQLDKLLSIFEQAHFVDDSHITKTFNHDIAGAEEVKLMANILHHAVTDPAERKLIEDEHEAWRTIDALFENERVAFEKKLQETNKALEEKGRELSESKKELHDKDEALRQMAAQLEELKQRLNKP